MSGFEGSFLGAADKISRQAIMECKVCWTPYDPAEGDETRGIDPGTAFIDLPHDWSCPNCSSPREQFLVREDPGSIAAETLRKLAAVTGPLEAEFREIWNAKMRDVPMVNAALHVEAVGFQFWNGRPLGVLISPWFMNLVMLEGDEEDWSSLTIGEKEDVVFPSGVYEFIHNTRPMIGGYKACALFSMMGDFNTQKQAVEVAEAVMVALFQEEHQAETDRSADIRAAREADLAAAAPVEDEAEDGEEDGVARLDAEPSRRAFLTAGLAEDERKEA